MGCVYIVHVQPAYFTHTRMHACTHTHTHTNNNDSTFVIDIYMYVCSHTRKKGTFEPMPYCSPQLNFGGEDGCNLVVRVQHYVNRSQTELCGHLSTDLQQYKL